MVKKILTFSFVLALFSCQNDLASFDGQDAVNNDIEAFSIHVIYEGKDFYSQCHLLNDSLIIEDNDLKVLIEKIYENNENVQTYVHQDGSIEYLINKEHFSENMDLRKNDNDEFISSKAGYYDQFDGYALMWFDPDYSGLMIDAVNIYKRIPQQIHFSFSNTKKISSIEIYLNYEYTVIGENVASVLDCYDERRNKLTLSCRNNFFPYRIPDLRKLPIGSSTWNDRIVSVYFSVKDPYK